MTSPLTAAALASEDEYALMFGKRCSSEQARRMAYRAIEAIRTPTNRMICAALEAPDRNPGTFSYSAHWKAMIYEALK